MPPCRTLAPLLLSVAMLPFDTHAAASLLVDDAGITDAQRCQLESWVRHTDGGPQWTAVPACTLAATEWSLGLTRVSDTSRLRWAVGAKRVLIAADQQRWALALGAGGGDAGDGNDWNLNLPLTLGLDAEQRVQLHVNVGLAREAGIRGRTDGIGLHIAFDPRWSLLAEIAHDAARQRGMQLGLRRALWRGASLDLLGGRQQQPAGDSHWMTIGLNMAALP